jgi:hypothetical protein
MRERVMVVAPDILRACADPMALPSADLLLGGGDPGAIYANAKARTVRFVVGSRREAVRCLRRTLWPFFWSWG